MTNQKIAIVGAGISGLGAAWALQQAGMDVTLYEAGAVAGGHMSYYELERDGQIERFDGFPGLMENSYNVFALCDLMGVPLYKQPIGFFYQHGNESWGSVQHTTYFQDHESECRRLVSLLTDLMERDAIMEASAQTFRDFLNYHGFTTAFAEHILTPVLGALMDTNFNQLMEFSPASFAELFGQELLSFDKPFKMVRFSNGISTLIDALTSSLKDRIWLNTGVVSIKRTNDYVEILDTMDRRIRYDSVILTTNFRANLDLLEDLSVMEKNIFSGIEYLEYTQLFHRDHSFLPPFFVKDGITEIVVTEIGSTTSPLMNRTGEQFDDVLITAAVHDQYKSELEQSRIYTQRNYLLEKITPASILAKSNIRHLQGHQRTWYCGLSTVPGLNEYCFVSGLAVADQLGAKYPFSTQDAPTAIFENVKRLMFTGFPSLRFS